jgi:uncharacterized protein involved in outer membrane biogenesis
VALELDRKDLRVILKWAGIVLGVLVVILGVTLALIDWDAMRGPIARYAAAKLNRPVAIQHLDVDVWSLTPTATITGVTVGNPEWEKRKNMLELERAQVQLNAMYLLRGEIVLPLVSIDKPKFYAHRAMDGHANWEFATRTGKPRQESSEPVDLPVIQRFMVNDGKLEVYDEIRKLRFDGTVQAKERSSNDVAKPFRMEGKGELNEKPFALQVAGGPLINLDPHEPYAFNASLQAADIKLDADAKLPKPFDMAKIVATLRLSGQDLADLYYITNLALPNTTPPYRLSATIERDNTDVKLTNISGRIGRSDMRGSIFIATGGKRPSMRGDLASDVLNFSDLAAPLGSKVARKQGTLDDAKQPPPPPADTPLLPDAKLQVNRVRAMDADVKYAAKAVNAGKLPLKRVAFHIQLNDGVLNIAPFAMEFPQGKMTGNARIDARRDVPQTDLDVRLTDLRLDQFAAKKPDAQPPFVGVMQARAKLQGTGDSVHNMAGSSDGTITFVVPQGEVRAAFAELTGINVARGLGLLLAKDQEKAHLRCGVADFKVEDGVMRAKNVVFDTEDVLITGRGEVRLKPEELDLELKGQPKEVRFMRLRTPIKVGGHLRKPSVGIDAGKTAKQTGIAAALGALVAPLAAVVAFVDPGLAEDADCAALFADAKASSKDASIKGAQTANNEPRN